MRMYVRSFCFRILTKKYEDEQATPKTELFKSTVWNFDNFSVIQILREFKVNT